MTGSKHSTINSRFIRWYRCALDIYNIRFRKLLFGPLVDFFCYKSFINVMLFLLVGSS